jgi:hypothetical protein
MMYVWWSIKSIPRRFLTLVASGTGARDCGGTYITRDRVLGVYH